MSAGIILNDGTERTQSRAWKLGGPLQVSYDSAGLPVLECTASGGGTIGGSGSIDSVAKFTGTLTIGNSTITDDGTDVVVGATLSATGKVSGPAATVSTASFNAPHGTAPTSPVNGDFWTTTVGFYARINGATVGPFGVTGAIIASDVGGTDDAERTFAVTDLYTFLEDLKVTGNLLVTGSNVTVDPASGDAYLIADRPATSTDDAGVVFKSVGVIDFWMSLLAADTTYGYIGTGTNLLIANASMRFTLSGSEVETIGKLKTASSVTANAGFFIAEGVAPTSPADGDLWMTAAGLFTHTSSGGTVGPFTFGSHPDPHVLNSGSAAAPTYTFAANTNTGMYYTTNAVSFSASSVEQLRILSGGEVLLREISIPGSPTDGMFWMTTNGMYSHTTTGGTVGPFGVGGVGSGSAGRVTRWATTTTLGDSLIQDDTTSLGIGIAPSSVSLLWMDWSSASTASQYELYLWSTWTVVSSNERFAQRARATLSASTGSNTGAFGSVYGGVETTGSGYTLSDAFSFRAYGSFAIGPSVYSAFHVTAPTGAASATTFYGFRCDAISIAHTTTYGLYIGNITGASNNVAIQTGTGDVVFGGKVTTVASGTSEAGFNLPHGVAPTSPVNGDVWTTTTSIYARINGSSIDLTLSSIGPGTANTITKWVTTTTVGDSRIIDIGSGNIQTGATLELPLSSGIVSTATSSFTYIAGGNIVNDGGNIILYGSTHANAGDIVFRDDAVEKLRYDASQDRWESVVPLILPGSTSSVAPLNSTPGSAPSSPVTGDIWMNTLGLYFYTTTAGTVGPLTGFDVGTGILNRLVRWATTTTLDSSSLTDNGSTVTSTLPLHLPNGSVSFPAWDFSGDNGNGAYLDTAYGSDIWSLAAGSANVARFGGTYLVSFTPSHSGTIGGGIELRPLNTATGSGDVLRKVYLGGSFINVAQSSITCQNFTCAASYGSSGTQSFTSAVELTIAGGSAGTVSISSWWGIRLDDPAGVSITTARGIEIESLGGSSNNYAIHINDQTGATNNWAIYSAGGMVEILGDGIIVGAATSGDMGVGTINVSDNIYKNGGSALFDYVFDHYWDNICNNRAYAGLMPLVEVEVFTRDHRRLPHILGGDGVGFFDQLETVGVVVEEAYLYLFNHETRLQKLESEVRDLQAEIVTLKEAA